MLIEVWHVEYCYLNPNCKLQITLLLLKKVYNLLYISFSSIFSIPICGKFQSRIEFCHISVAILFFIDSHSFLLLMSSLSENFLTENEGHVERNVLYLVPLKTYS